MTDEELDRIDRLAAAATPGPWFAHNTDDHLFMNVYCVTTSPLEPVMDGTPDRPSDVEYADVVALTLFSEPRLVDHASGKFSEDTAFIAAARTAVPELVAEVRRARADLAAAQAVVRSLAERVKAQSDLLARRAARCGECDHLRERLADMGHLQARRMADEKGRALGFGEAIGRLDARSVLSLVFWVAVVLSLAQWEWLIRHLSAARS